MAVTKLELPDVPPKASWAVTGIFPIGHVSMLYAPAGVGKTRLVSYLAAQLTRPYPNGLFLGHEVRGGPVLILDADDPSGFGYQLWLPRFLAAHGDTRRNMIDLRSITGGFTPNDVEALKAELKIKPPRLIVIDTFASAFTGLDILRAHHVQAALTGLAELAKELKCAVLILDHVGKLQPGQTVASKGPYGAAKTFSPRAVFALSRVPPKEVEGRDILKVECIKMSYAPEPHPIGIEITLEKNDTVAYAKLADLPGKNMLEAAVEVMEAALKAQPGELITRKELLGRAIEAQNVTERYAEKALSIVLEKLGKGVETTQLKGRGSPKLYTYLNPSAIEDSNVPDDESTSEQPSSEIEGSKPANKNGGGVQECASETAKPSSALAAPNKEPAKMPEIVKELHRRYLTGELKGQELKVPGGSSDDAERALEYYFHKNPLTDAEEHDLRQIALEIVGESAEPNA